MIDVWFSRYCILKYAKRESSSPQISKVGCPANKFRVYKFKLKWVGRGNGGDSIYMGVMKYIIEVFKRNFMEFIFIRIFDFNRRIWLGPNDSDLRYRGETQAFILLIGDQRDGRFSTFLFWSKTVSFVAYLIYHGEFFWIHLLVDVNWFFIFLSIQPRGDVSFQAFFIKWAPLLKGGFLAFYNGFVFLIDFL